MSLYGKLSAEFYDLDKPEAPPDALEYYLQQAAHAAGPILEPMCGTGRFLLPLLAAGFDVEGSDASAEMLALCRANAERLGLDARLAEQRLEELETSRKFGLVFVPSGSFCLLTDTEVVKKCLQRIHAALAPRGRFIFEVERRVRQKPSELSGAWGGRWVSRPDGAKLLFSWLSRYTAPSGIFSAVHRYELVADGRLIQQEFEDFELKLYELSEIRQLLHAAGFPKIQMLEAYSQEPVNETSEAQDEEGIIVVAERGP
ncbi:MAG TPA: class I SAM-dependent methyltransferase [Polyangiaceae bacterium]|nr:class I SAM-dependent methyltransferase [Polyangiaceae bacterium]